MRIHTDNTAISYHIYKETSTTNTYSLLPRIYGKIIISFIEFNLLRYP